MTKNDDLNKLFDEWKQRRLLFCEDGILHEDFYNKSPFKILFALKDVNNPRVNRLQENEKSSDGKSLDMRRVLLETNEKEEKTWAPIFEWLSILLDTSCPENYFAFINLKKDEGQGSISGATLRQYTCRDADLIRRQIQIISPDVVISCGRDVFESLHECVYQNCTIRNNEIQLTEKMHDYGRLFDAGDTGKPLYIIEYCHPANRGRGTCTSEEHRQNMIAIRNFIMENCKRNV